MAGVLDAVAVERRLRVLDRRTESEAEQVQGALRTRVVIEQAKGALALFGGVGVDDAFTALRRHARTGRRPLADIARAVVDGGIGPGDVVDRARSAWRLGRIGTSRDPRLTLLTGR